LDPKDVHFLETREAKVATIAAIGCQAFVDDLPAVLLHPSFPARTERFWLAGGKFSGHGDGLVPYRNWEEVRQSVELLVLSRQGHG
jgi:hypothetical protein